MILSTLSTVLVFYVWSANYHRLCGLKQQKFIFSQFWSSQAQNQCWQSCCTFFPGIWGESIPCLSPSCWWLPTILSIPWLPLHYSNLCLHLHITFSSMCLYIILFYLTRILVVGFTAHPDNPGWPPHLKIFNLITCAIPRLPNEVKFTGSEN